MSADSASSPVLRWTAVCRAEDIPAGEMKAFTVEGLPIAIYNVEGEFYATGDTCTHEEASLADGYLTNHRIECPLHGSEFDITTGEALSLPAVLPIKTYELRIDSGELLVSLAAI